MHYFLLERIALTKDEYNTTDRVHGHDAGEEEAQVAVAEAGVMC